MLQQLASLIPKNSEIFIECVNAFDIFRKLPDMLDCEKSIYCTSSLPLMLCESDDNAVYLNTADLLSEIMDSMNSLPFSIVIMHVTDITDPSWNLIVDLLRYYRKTRKTLSPKTVFIGKSSSMYPCDAAITLKQATSEIQFDHLSDIRNKRYERISSLVKRYSNKTITVIVPTDTHVKLVSKYIGLCNKLRDDAICSSNAKVTICTVNNCHFVNGSDIVIDMMLAPVKNTGIINVTNHTRLITKGESNVHRLLADYLYIPMCSNKVYESLPDEVDTKQSIYTLEKHALLLHSHGLNATDILGEFQVLHDYHLVSLGKLTHAGKFCLECPLNVRKAMIIYFMHVRKSPHLFLHLCVICTTEVFDSNLFRWPNRTSNETLDFLATHDKITYYETNFGGYSDITTLYNIWLAVIKQPFTINNIKAFCYKHELSFYTLKRAFNLINQCLSLGISNHRSIDADTSTLANELFRYLEVIMPETKASVSYRNGKPVLINGEDTYEINDKSVHSMHIGSQLDQDFYILASKETINKGMTLKCATLIHATDDDCDTDSILSDF